MQENNPHESYYKAAFDVLAGTPVQNLNSIKRECDTDYFIRTMRQNPQKYVWGTEEKKYIPLIVEAENKLLQGQSLQEAYHFLKEPETASPTPNTFWLEQERDKYRTQVSNNVLKTLEEIRSQKRNPVNYMM